MEPGCESGGLGFAPFLVSLLHHLFLVAFLLWGYCGGCGDLRAAVPSLSVAFCSSGMSLDRSSGPASCSCRLLLVLGGAARVWFGGVIFTQIGVVRLLGWSSWFFPTWLSGFLSFPSFLFSVICSPCVVLACVVRLGWVPFCFRDFIGPAVRLIWGWLSFVPLGVGRGAWVMLSVARFGCVRCHSVSAVFWALLSGSPYYICGAVLCWLTYTRSLF